MRVAAVDLGTNSTRLLIADVEGDNVDELVRRSVVTRLGEQVDGEKHLQPGAIARVRAVLDEYDQLVVEHQPMGLLAVATSAVRDAANGRDFMDALTRDYGFPTRILTGDEEADLTRRGVGMLEPTTLLLDVGGGSTELTLGDFKTSLDIGSVRITERFLVSDPPADSELDAAAEHVRSLLPELEPAAAVGVAGTLEQLHAVVGELTLGALESALETLSDLPLAQREQVPDMDPARAPVIVGGALIVVEVLRRYGLSEIALSRAELLDGVALLVANG
jgi:exopolyphosphatase/guanosine-5'-triphosphate,3'-diphosphate pyrophosphatase